MIGPRQHEVYTALIARGIMPYIIVIPLQRQAQERHL
jgi:hypothetical protein